MIKFKVGDLVQTHCGDLSGHIQEIQTEHKYCVQSMFYEESELELVKGAMPHPTEESVFVNEETVAKPSTWYGKQPNEWPCEHWRTAQPLDEGEVFDKFSFGGRAQLVPTGLAKNCLFCGAKRPEPKKEALNSFIKKTYDEIDDHYEGHFERADYMVKAIREHLKSKEGEITNLITEWKLSPGSQVASKLAKQILKVLGVE